MQLTWVLVGGYVDPAGEHQTYALVEWSSASGLSLSAFRNSCNFWKSVHELHPRQAHILHSMIQNGTTFLCRDANGQWGYCNSTGMHEFEDQTHLDSQVASFLLQKCTR